MVSPCMNVTHVIGITSQRLGAARRGGQNLAIEVVVVILVTARSPGLAVGAAAGMGNL